MREWIEPPDVISIHALHEESDPAMDAGQAVDVFQSTLSMRRATEGPSARDGHDQFQSTLSMRRATRWLPIIHIHRSISIHALHEESDRHWYCWRF